MLHPNLVIAQVNPRELLNKRNELISKYIDKEASTIQVA